MDDLRRGLEHYRNGRYEQALEAFERWDEANPEASGPYYRALCLLKMEDYRGALPFLEQLWDREDNFLRLLQARLLKAYALVQLELYKDAETVLQSILDEGMESAQVASLYAYTQWALGRHGEAVRWYNRALKADPRNPNVLNALGYVLAEQGQHLGKALQFSRRAVSLKPDNGAYLDSLGWVYHRMGQPKLALFHLKKALSLSEAAEIRRHAAAVLKELESGGS